MGGARFQKARFCLADKLLSFSGSWFQFVGRTEYKFLQVKIEVFSSVVVFCEILWIKSLLHYS